MFNRYLCIFSAAIVTALTGCASLPEADSSATDVSAPPVRTHVEFRHALPVVAETEDEIVAGSVNVAAPSGLIDYDARYELQAGKLFEALREGDGDFEGAGEEVALQTMAQKLGSSVPLPAGGPLRLEVTNRERSRLGNGDARRSRSTRAAVQWSPGPVDLKLRWSAPRGQLPSRTADCNLRADLELPASFIAVASSSTFELSSQRCRVRAPEAGPAEVALERWGAAWSWAVGTIPACTCCAPSPRCRSAIRRGSRRITSWGSAIRVHCPVAGRQQRSCPCFDPTRPNMITPHRHSRRQPTGPPTLR